MSLPNEKPRPSVANLIGRFEHQQKKQRSSSPVSRGLGVVSHSTGDSAKEETKEKREWPPRSASATSNITGDAAKEAMKREWPPRAPASNGSFTSEWPPKQPAVESEVSVPPGSKSPLEKSPLSRTSSQSTPKVEDPPKEETVEPPATKDPVPEKQLAVEEKPALVVDPVSTLKPPSATSATTRPLSKSVKSPPKPSAKLPPPSSFSKSLHPPKSESRDRRSSASATPTASTSGGRSRPTSRATVRSKTPSNARPPPAPQTPSSKTRPPPVPRTPAPAVRPPAATPKTPRTGLYAPTAASLAKAYNAQPPQPERKKTLSSSISLDRLSKPTAASLSKARTPAVVNNPPPPQRKTATPAKPRTNAPSRMKPTTTKGKEAVGATLAAAASGAVASAALLDAQGTVEVEHTNGHAVSTDGEQEQDSEILLDSAVGSHPDIVLSDVEGQEHVDEEILPHEGSHHDEPAGLENASPIASDNEPETSVAKDAQVSVVHPTDSVDPAANLHHASDEEEQNPEVESEPEAAEDIEDIVNLLETTSFTSKAISADPIQTLTAHEVEKDLKPETVALLDQAVDIPDEE